MGRTWLAQARADLAAAEDSAATGHHEWACFQAQQAGEKALEALLYARGRTSIVTHSDIDLLVVGDLPGRVFDQVGEVLRRTTLPGEPIVMRAEAFERRRRVGDPFLRAIIGEGLRLVQEAAP